MFYMYMDAKNIYYLRLRSAKYYKDQDKLNSYTV